MIAIKREPPPPEFSHRAAQATREILHAIEQGMEPRRIRDVVARRQTIWEIIRPVLERMFHQKCAYCESLYGTTSPVDIELYRPKGGVKEADGAFPLHYVWLAFDWNNLHPSCARCNRPWRGPEKKGLFGKASRFPILGMRAKTGAFGEALDDEQPLLLDPCRDQPHAHLRFNDEGVVVGISQRGEETINILGLNRDELIKARRRRAVTVLNLIDSIRRQTPSVEPRSLLEQFAGLREMLADSAEYAGLARDVANIALKGLFESAGYSDVYEFIRSSKTPHQDAMDAQRAFRQLESVSLAGSAGQHEKTKSAFRARVWRIEWIQVKNIKALSDVRIDVAGGHDDRTRDPATLPVGDQPERAPWTVLLGENATGKSTLLKIIALALVGRDYQDRLQDPPATYVRQGCKSGWVKVKLSGNRQPHMLTFTAEGNVEDLGRKRAQTLLLAYGTTHLSPKSDVDPSHKSYSYARVDNLFHARASLIDVNDWLEELRAQETDKFEEVRTALGRVLLFEGNEEVFYDKEANPPCLKVRLRDAVVAIDQLSDGYRAVLTLTADILSVLLWIWPTAKRAEGVVLIDELGNHLHPRWKMHLVSRLREVLPKVQFIATTHDPLCLRGLEDGEVIVLKRSARGRVYSVADLPPVKSLRVDQLLMSEHFGLSSTQDPESERFFRDYYALLAKAVLTSADTAKLNDMRREVPNHASAGRTHRERLMLDAIDYHLANEPKMERADQRRASQEALEDVLARILRDQGQ